MTPQRGKGCVRVLHSAHPSALALVVVLAFGLAACGPAGGGGGGFGAEYQVNVADDGVCNSGHCSLREAINAANAHVGLDLIKFDIGGGGAQTIRPLSVLPEITDAVTIDRRTQPGFAGIPIIELNGANATVNANGLTIRAANCRVRGLVINRFHSGQGPSIGSGAGIAVLEGG